MSRQEIKLCIEAVRWWRSHCPVGYTENQHRDNPTINCANEFEKRLAIAVVNMLNSKPQANE